ncbi:MAG: hypothetical protein NW226_16980 [Microscillaceae bacterium]|nr:hypothetical protein [Microscillaceae bacterium]
MLFIFIIWLYIAFVSYILGSFVLKLSFRFLQISVGQMDNFPIISLIGLGYLSVICNVLSLFMPMRLMAHLIVLSLLLAILLGNYKHLWQNIQSYFGQFQGRTRILLAVFFTFLAVQSLPISYRTDESSYYIQTIRWMEQYPVIMGLGNIAPCYSYNSSWHLLCAFFRCSFLGFDNLFNDLNGYLYGMIFLYALPGIQLLGRGSARFRELTKIAVIVLGYFLMRGVVATITADMAVAFFVWLILTLWFEELLFQEKNSSWVYLVSLALFVFTIKLSAILLTLVPFYFFWKSIYLQKIRQALYISALCLIFCVPYFTKNVLSSGYLLSPMTMIDVFEVDWKVPKALDQGGLIGFDYLLEPYLTGITHQRELLEDEEGKLTIVGKRLTFKELIIENLIGLNLYSLLFIGSIVLVVIIHAILWIKKPPYFRQISLESDFRMLFMMMYLGILFILFLIPSWKTAQFRIGMGFLLFYISSTLPVLFFLIQEKYQKRAAYVLYVFIILLVIKNLYNVEDKPFLFQNYWLYPPKYPEVPTQKTKVGNITFYVVIQNELPKEIQCWGSEIPCYSEYPTWIEARGDGIKDGFRWKKK